MKTMLVGKKYEMQNVMFSNGTRHQSTWIGEVVVVTKIVFVVL